MTLQFSSIGKIDYSSRTKSGLRYLGFLDLLDSF
jgi:hypothetical protein